MGQRIAVSARHENAIDALLVDGLTDPEQLSQLGRLSCQLILQRAVEDELAIFLGRARYQRTAEATGSRNGHRPRRTLVEHHAIAALVAERELPPVAQQGGLTSSRTGAYTVRLFQYC